MSFIFKVEVKRLIYTSIKKFKGGNASLFQPKNLTFFLIYLII